VSRRRIVVTGVGAVTPLGAGAETLFERWSDGESGIADGLGRCSHFDPTEHLKRKEIKRYDRFTQFAIVAAEEALAAAGWDEALPVAADRIGCVIGTGNGGSGTLEEGLDALIQGPEYVSSLLIPKSMANAASGVLALRFGLEGPAFAVVSACSSGADAITDGIRMLRLGETDAMVVGGAEAEIVRMPLAAFANMEALSEKGISRPFDARRDGFVMGEGAGILVLEGAEVAEARGAHVYGEILGYGITNDAHHIVAPHPEGRGAILAIQRALEDAGLHPDDVDYVNAHGTGTPANDRSETRAIKAVLGDRAKSVPVSSLKSSIGHLIGAAGAVESVATLIALERQIAPPTLNYEVPEEGLDLDYVPKKSRPLFGSESANETNGHRPVAISNAFGFGGHNSVLVLAAAE
jgi:3-oxoacyl-[acyl-carrier-protein] synthase II